MLSFNFNKFIINKDLRDYIRKSNDISLNKKNKRKDNVKKEHPSGYEFNFCDLSEFCDCNECNEYKNKTKNYDVKKFISYQANKYILFFFMFLGGGSIISISLLCYNNYIKK